MNDTKLGQPIGSYRQLSANAIPTCTIFLLRSRAPLEIGYVMAKCVDASAVGRHRIVGEKPARHLA